MDGPLTLTRIVKRHITFVQTGPGSDPSMSVLQVDSLQQDAANKSIIALLCSDLMVLCRDPNNASESDGKGLVDLYAVLRMQGSGGPAASVVQGSTLRVVDTRAILYFQAPSTSDALIWSRGKCGPSSFSRD